MSSAGNSSEKVTKDFLEKLESFKREMGIASLSQDNRSKLERKLMELRAVIKKGK